MRKVISMRTKVWAESGLWKFGRRGGLGRVLGSRTAVVIALLGVLIAPAVGFGSPVTAQNARATCVITQEGSAVRLSFAGDLGSSVNLRRNSQWVATVTGKSSFVPLAGGTTGYVIRVRGGVGPDHVGCKTTTTRVLETPAEFVCDGPCNVVIEGDSLTRGLVNRLCNRVDGLSTCHNSGVGGDLTDQMLASAPSDVDARLGRGGNDILFLWAGTNDLWQRAHGPDPATNAAVAAENIETYIAERRAAGWDFIVLTNLPQMKSAIQGVDELNSLIQGIEADAHIDLRSDLKLQLGNTNGFRDPDNVHFSRDGYDYIVDTYYIPQVLQLQR